MDNLRAACGRALQAQRGITAYLQPAVGSQGNLGVEVAAQVGGVAVLVSDSESAVEPCQTTVHKRPRIAAKPSWLFKNKNTRRKERRRSDNRKKARERILDKARDQARNERPERKAQDAKKHAKRYHVDFTVRAAANAQRKKSRHQGAQGSERLVVPKSARADRTGVLVREGSWKRTADESARPCQQDGPSHLPP